MTGSRAWRWVALTGPAAAVLLAVGAALQLDGVPGAQDAPSSVISHYAAHEGRTVAVATLGAVSAVLLLVFFSHLRALARERIVAPGPGPTLMIGGAVLWAAGLLLVSVLALALATAATGDMPETARTLNVLSHSLWALLFPALAVTMVGAGLTVLRSGLVPTWTGWVAVVVGGLSALGPVGVVGLVLAPLWVLVVGFLCVRHPEDARHLGRAGGPAAASRR